METLAEPPEGTTRPAYYMVKHHVLLETFMFLGGILWFLLLPSDNIHASSYFSENSLLPGLVKGGFVEDSHAKVLLGSLKDEIAAHPGQMPYPWLLAQFRQIGLDAYAHNFTLNYPLVGDMAFQGQNVYGILRAPRGASTEAIVFSVPYRSSTSAYATTAPGIALMLALAKFARRQKYWAKDLIFLITEHEQLGAQAWLEAYHKTSSGRQGILNSGDLIGRGGAIQAAVNLELHSDRISHIDVKIEGLNGQLPNLDLVNLVHMLCNKEGVRHTVHNRVSLRDLNVKWSQFQRWQYSFGTLVQMVLSQAGGVPNGNHGLFHRFGIEAITLQGFNKVDKGSPATFYQVGRVMEGVLRSLNNLLERFHQSFFFYLLSGTDRFVSIGVYMSAVVLMIAALLLRALSVWRNMHITPNKEDTKTLAPTEEISNCFAPVGMTVLYVHFLGVILMRIPEWSAKYASELPSHSPETAVALGMFAFTSFTLLSPAFAVKTKNSITILYVIALIELATILVAISVHNFSLAFLSSVIFVPFALFSTTKRLRWLQTVCWFMLQPLLLIGVMILVYTAVEFPDGPILMKAMNALRDALTFGVVDYLVYGNWMFSVITSMFFPTWLLFWIVNLNRE